MKNQIIQIVSQTVQKDIKEISDNISLRNLGINSSIALNQLRSLLVDSFRKKMPPLTMQMTVNDLINIVEKSNSDGQNGIFEDGLRDAELSKIIHLQSKKNLQIGIDIELKKNFPYTEDYRNHPFFIQNFTMGEVSRGLLKPDPTEFYIGLFAAKEAVKKCGFDFLVLELNAIEIDNDIHGRPFVVFHDEKIAHNYQIDISISHTDEIVVASAIVVKL